MDPRTSDRRAWRQRPSVLVAAGALPLVIIAAGAGAAAAAAPAVGADYQAPAVRNAAAGFRPAPGPGYLAPVDTAALHLPVPVAQVAPIAPPSDRLRIGDTVLGIPPWLNHEQVMLINNAAAEAEARAATFYDSVGIAPSRSDRMAAGTVGGTVAGAETGATAAIPFALVAALFGGVAGLGAGIPMLPAGLIFMPMVGATLGAGLVTSTFALAGGMVGAVAGAVGAAAEQPTAVPASPSRSRPARIRTHRVSLALGADVPEPATPTEDLIDTLGGRALSWLQQQPLAEDLVHGAEQALDAVGAT